MTQFLKIKTDLPVGPFCRTSPSLRAKRSNPFLGLAHHGLLRSARNDGERAASHIKPSFRGLRSFARIPNIAHVPNVVMPGLVPGIHVLPSISKKDVDGRDKPGHDE
ncbi:hypothetical protein [Bradyrhizobium sp. JYMT SZCCT0180]|uniref:hypothetical protein n=1 Tax=Bradyrhizobium sp. JYMT SZCCT0180 TaxID=2807666 RepID=UPI001BAABF78|nr:hypothetical protein [Bradyrhizobium sp. JYMT SZCCT0180]MBR1212993.1 hypothetical protein [Bradyrhizobium sp. JYMT SZCCT0180]